MSTSGREVDGDIVMMCPNKCTKETTVTGGNVQSLSKNFAVMELIQSESFTCTMPLVSEENNCDICEDSRVQVVCPTCAVALCQKCSAEIHSKKGYQVHSLLPVSDLSDRPLDFTSGRLVSAHRLRSNSALLSEQIMCKKHPQELVEYMCESCCETVCKRCHLVDEHRGHDCKLLSELAHKKRQSIRHLLSTVQQKHATWNRGFDHCQELRERVNMRHKDLQKEVKSHFCKIHSGLQSQEEKILRELNEEMTNRDQLLSEQARYMYILPVCEVMML